jgi:NNMT/PNMT/TEMT family protein
MVEPHHAPSQYLNRQAPWGAFDSRDYHDHNYQDLRDDDLQIMERVRDHFGAAGVDGGRGIDIGAGTNLYPALAMLPFCTRIDLREFSEPNVEWLRRQVRGGYATNWDQFWSVYQKHPAYAGTLDPRAALRERVRVQRQSVFDLPKARWDIGTMFFVACSISTEMCEFDLAVRTFAQSLRPGAPLAAAFMKKSTGYPVGDIVFPAVPIDEHDIRRSFASVAEIEVHEVVSREPLRPGYESMIITLGHTVC